MTDTDLPYNRSGLIPPSAPIQVTLHPDECVVQPTGAARTMRCVRADHDGRACRDGWPVHP
jgi:hypothetical protein